MKFYKQTFIVLLFLISCLNPAQVLATETGVLAPDFKLMSVQGQEVSLSDFKGRLVLLKLASTWCPTCRQLDGEIAKIGTLLKEHDVVVLDVFVQDSQATVEKYLGDTEHPMAFFALLDDGQAYDAYNVYLIPRLLFIDARQIVRFDSAGRNMTAEGLSVLVKEFSLLPVGDVSLQVGSRK